VKWYWQGKVESLGDECCSATFSAINTVKCRYLKAWRMTWLSVTECAKTFSNTLNRINLIYLWQCCYDYWGLIFSWPSFFLIMGKTQRLEIWIFLHPDVNTWHSTYQVGLCVLSWSLSLVVMFSRIPQTQ